MAAPIISILKDSARGFGRDDCPRSAAALAYSIIFALPPLLILLIMIAGAVWDPQEVQSAMESEVGAAIGPDAAQQVQSMIAQADRPDSGGPLAVIVGVGALLFSATGAFIALQGALNRAWEVAPDPESGGIRNFIMKRLLSVGMMFGIAFLLLVSLAVSALLGVLGETIAQMLPSVFSGPLLWTVDVALSLLIITALFAGIFRVLPDAHIEWRDVWVGALFTAVLFVLGKYALSFYLSQSDPGSAFGAAGSLIVLLVWIYYASMIVLFGAEFTQSWAEHHGHEVVPADGAVRVERRLSRIDRDADASDDAGRSREAERSGARQATPPDARRAARGEREPARESAPWPKVKLLASGVAAYSLLRLLHRPRRREWAAAPDPR